MIIYISCILCVMYRESNTWRSYIWKFFSSVLTRYHTSECSKRVKYHVDTRREISYLQATMCQFCFLYGHTNGDVFHDFPKSSDHFRKILDFPKLKSEHFANMFEHSRRFQKIAGIAEDDQKRSEVISIIHQQIYVQLKGLKKKTLSPHVRT